MSEENLAIIQVFAEELLMPILIVKLEASQAGDTSTLAQMPQWERGTSHR